MVIDVALLLDLADHGAAALSAGDETRKGEVVLPALGLLGEAPVEHSPHPLPKLDGHERIVPALDELAVPLEPTRIEPVTQDGVDGTHWHLLATSRIDQARLVRLASYLFQRDVAVCVPLE